MSVPSIDFSALGSQAKDIIAADAAPAVVPAAQPEPQQQAAPVSPPSPQPTAVPDPLVQGGQPAEPLFEVDFGNGKKETFTAKQIQELQSSGLRQADYTRKTQELANQREEIQRNAYLVDQARALLSNPQALLQAAQQQLQATQPPPAPIDPNAPVTVAQLQNILAQQQTQMQGVQQAAQTYVEERLQVAKLAEDINGTLNTLYTTHPVLKALPEFEDVLRFRVAQAKPQSLEETVSAFNAAAADITGKLDQVFTAKQQHAAVARTTMVAQAAEPPGGTPAVATQTPSFMTKNGREVDWKSLSLRAQQVASGV